MRKLYVLNEPFLDSDQIRSDYLYYVTFCEISDFVIFLSGAQGHVHLVCVCVIAVHSPKARKVEIKVN